MDNKIEQFYRFLALVLSDHMSSMLKLNFDLKDVRSTQSPYQELCQEIPKFSFIGLFKYQKRGIMLAIDPKIIYILSNRMLGGKGVIETKPKPMFTESEAFFGKDLVNWFSGFYKQYGIKVDFIRIENDINYIHFFYGEETVLGTRLSCKINGKAIGAIVACHPLSLAEKDAFSWEKN